LEAIEVGEKWSIVSKWKIIITHDVGFGSMCYFSKRGKVGILILRMHPPTVEEVNSILVDFLSKVNSEKKNLNKKVLNHVPC
jgi:hypothetical protein